MLDFYDFGPASKFMVNYNGSLSVVVHITLDRQVSGYNTAARAKTVSREMCGERQQLNIHQQEPVSDPVRGYLQEVIWQDEE